MVKYSLLVLVICSLLCVPVLFAENQKEQSIKGKIEKVIPQENTVILNGKEFFITPELIEYAYLEEGDIVELIVVQTENGQEVIDYFYIFGEDEDETITGYTAPPMSIDDFSGTE